MLYAVGYVINHEEVTNITYYKTEDEALYHLVKDSLAFCEKAGGLSDALKLLYIDDFGKCIATKTLVTYEEQTNFKVTRPKDY